MTAWYHFDTMREMRSLSERWAIGAARKVWPSQLDDVVLPKSHRPDDSRHGARRSFPAVDLRNAGHGRPGPSAVHRGSESEAEDGPEAFVNVVDQDVGQAAGLFAEERPVDQLEPERNSN
jgi:hypothetical protein